MKIDNIKAALHSQLNNLNLSPAVPKPQTADIKNVVTPDNIPNGKKNIVSDDKINPPTVSFVSPIPASSVDESEKSESNDKSSRKPRKKSDITTLDIENIVNTFLRPTIDYDLIPNCGRKPSLLKAGAEHLASIFNFRTSSEVIHRIVDLEKSFILYEVATTVFNSNGEIVAVGLGSCNSTERKFIKQGFATSLNTVIKMARKRSFVDAILSATSASRIFTQDIEELAANSVSSSDNK